MLQSVCEIHKLFSFKLSSVGMELSVPRGPRGCCACYPFQGCEAVQPLGVQGLPRLYGALLVSGCPGPGAPVPRPRAVRLSSSWLSRACHGCMERFLSRAVPVLERRSRAVRLSNSWLSRACPGCEERFLSRAVQVLKLRSRAVSLSSSCLSRACHDCGEHSLSRAVQVR